MNAKKIIGINVLSILVIGALGIGGGVWYNDAHNYISTDNANIEGKMITVQAPANGTLTEWGAQKGSNYQTGDVLGAMNVQMGNKTKTINIKMPQTATLVQESTYPNEQVAAGSPLAYAFNLNKLYVQANIKETNIQNVHIGNKVDIHVDAYPNISYTGTVSSIGKATLSTFSLLPQSNDTGNFTKVTQVIPVIIRFDNQSTTGLLPGLSVEVRIHRN